MRDVKPIIKSDPGRAVTSQLSQVPVASPRRVKKERPSSPGPLSPFLPSRPFVSVKAEALQEDLALGKCL